jgi:hypothetical protein
MIAILPLPICMLVVLQTLRALGSARKRAWRAYYLREIERIVTDGVEDQILQLVHDTEQILP